jgi:DNA-binding protein H-NS
MVSGLQEIHSPYAHECSNGHAIMNAASSNLKAMSIDKLTKFREQVDAMLNSKVAEERRTVEQRLGTLDRLVANGARVKGAGRGLRGAVAPKYRNPENPAETWAGRGLKPRWLQAALKSGTKIDDFLIAASAKTPRAKPRKARAK